jgi:hypothetical protein
MGDDYGNITSNQFGGELSGPIAASLRVANIKYDVSAFRITKSLQAAEQRLGKRMGFRRGHQNADMRDLRSLLRKHATSRKAPGRAATQ